MLSTVKITQTDAMCVLYPQFLEKRHCYWFRVVCSVTMGAGLVSIIESLMHSVQFWVVI